MVLAAGYGERLRPLTLVRPKPLVPILNKPMLFWVLRTLRHAGILHAAVNMHHLPASFQRHLQEFSVDNVSLAFAHESSILGTGGGIRNLSALLPGRGPFAVINGDVLTDLDIRDMAAEHKRNGALASLALHDLPRFNQVAVNGSDVVGFPKRQAVLRHYTRTLAFMGVHLIERELLKHIPEGKVDIISVYQKLIDQGAHINAYVSAGCLWQDVGTIPDYREIHATLLNGEPHPEFSPMTKEIMIHPDQSSDLTQDECFEGWACVGRDVVLHKSCRIINSVLWDNVRVGEGVTIRNCILADGVTVSGDVEDEVLTGP